MMGTRPQPHHGVFPRCLPRSSQDLAVHLFKDMAAPHRELRFVPEQPQRCLCVTGAYFKLYRDDALIFGRIEAASGVMLARALDEQSLEVTRRR
jgi:hypothetical protein